MAGGKADGENDIVEADKGKGVVFKEDSRKALGVACDWAACISSEMKMGKGTSRLSEDNWTGFWYLVGIWRSCENESWTWE